jgi:hypothetical protein
MVLEPSQPVRNSRKCRETRQLTTKNILKQEYPVALCCLQAAVTSKRLVSRAFHHQSPKSISHVEPNQQENRPFLNNSLHSHPNEATRHPKIQRNRRNHKRPFSAFQLLQPKDLINIYRILAYSWHYP